MCVLDTDFMPLTSCRRGRMVHGWWAGDPPEALPKGGGPGVGLGPVACGARHGEVAGVEWQGVTGCESRGGLLWTPWEAHIVPLRVPDLTLRRITIYYWIMHCTRAIDCENHNLLPVYSAIVIMHCTRAIDCENHNLSTCGSGPPEGSPHDFGGVPRWQRSDNLRTCKSPQRKKEHYCIKSNQQTMLKTLAKLSNNIKKRRKLWK